MPSDYLHNHRDFAALIRIVAAERAIDPGLVEKDYWIMHGLFGLQQMGLTFELKGGTSLSKGFRIIDRFSEDIDIRIEPPAGSDVKTGRNHTKPAHIESRRAFYDGLASSIQIDGVTQVVRDTEFDNDTLMSGGIRLSYKRIGAAVESLKEGILLELGFDDVTPNEAVDISSWAYDHAVDKVAVIDNRAKGVRCYDPGRTLVEKLQTISTKFRKQQISGEFPANFMRHYYDVYALLRRPDVQAFIGTEAYQAHKARRFRTGDNPDLAANQAFLLSDPATRALYKRAYDRTSPLYYGARPSLEEILEEFAGWSRRL